MKWQSRTWKSTALENPNRKKTYTVKVSLYTRKEIIYKTEKQWADWEKIFANDILDKGLISKIYKYVIQLSIKKIKQSNLKKDRGPNKHFSKEDMQMANGHRKRCSTSLTNREIKIKTTWDITSHHSESVQFSSVTQSCETLRPHGSQHSRPPCPSPTPRVYPNSCPLSRWCHFSP